MIVGKNTKVIEDVHGWSRRDFLRIAAVAGAGVALTPLAARAQEGTNAAEELRIALVGAGSQGRILMQACLNIPNIRFVAVCDIWEYSRRYAENVLKRYDQQVNVYSDFDDMMSKEDDLDAVLVATPDLFHAPQTNACLEAGIHVYCEKEMANTIEACASMVRTARSTGKLLQIGHQRRSNPRYKHAERLIHKDKVLGRVTAINGQWNRPVQEPLGFPRKYPIPADVLERYGYADMETFRNWRWYKKFAGGPIADLGSHQIDIYNWFLDAVPTSVSAIGGIDYYGDGREWPDNVMVNYEYDTPTGKAQAFYQVLNTTSYGGYYEVFMGDEGSLQISEDTTKGFLIREVAAPRREWEDEAERVNHMGTDAIELQIGASRTARGEASPEALAWEADAEKPIHQPHLENFFRAIREGTPLTSPPEDGYRTAVTVLKVNEAIAAGTKLQFSPSDFEVT